MHTHMSIFQVEGVNAFYSSDDPHHLSADAKHFIAGVLNHVREMALVTNQWFNSYKRLVPGYEAPVYIAWAERNRSASGEDVHRKLIETKLVEADEFRLYISPKDLEEHRVP